MVSKGQNNTILAGNRREGRSTEIDVIKGLAIILIVIGHTYPVFRESIYLFHVAVFFMASGYCYRGINDISEFKIYIIKKIKGLYIPYVVLNLILVSLVNFFIKVNIYSNDPNFLVFAQNAIAPQSLTAPSSILIILKDGIRILTGIGPTQLASPTWFLTQLLLLLIINAIIDLLITRLDKKVKIVVYVGIFLLMSALAMIFYDLKMLLIVKRFPATYLSFLLGMLIKRINIEKIYHYISIPIILCLLYVLPNYGSIEMSAAQIVNPLFFCFCSILGWILLMSISKVICKINIINSIIIYIGKNSIYIVAFHIIFFRVASYIYAVYNDLPLYSVASNPIIFGVPWWYKVVYCIVGIVFSLGVGELIKHLSISRVKYRSN